MKLIFEEAESRAFASAFEQWPRPVSSGILRTEALRAASRLTEGDVAATEATLEGVTTIPVSERLLTEAGRVGPPELRSLDALHLASALSLGDDLGVLLSYDARLLQAARAAGVATASPR